MKVLIHAAALAIASSSLAQPSPERGDTGTDLLWKKLETRVDEIVSRFDGVMGIAILDLTDGRALLRNADAVFRRPAR